MADTIVERVSFLQIPVKNLEESTVWYVNYLGCRIQWKRPDNKMTILELPSGPEIFLCETELHQGTMSVVIGFETEDIMKLLFHLKSNGVKIGEIRQDRGVVEYEEVKEILGIDFDFYDPSGNMLVAHSKSTFEE
ncbi:VOC family protein [Paenibacillus guangzhouensis]|uniref:VOC family protein n=1 Tax=Paenibacillus guangzhouensis TaxID=1473112 RepID=UPI001266B59A|nr:VOC family protein [Paenibacillus guangzhouensis]